MTNKRTISIHQPAYMPWMGYLDRIYRSDVFVFLDNVQFERNSFINRNKIKTKDSVRWLTVPVNLKNHMISTISDTLIADNISWRNNHIIQIELNYKKGNFFKENILQIYNLLNGTELFISDLCFNHLKFWMSEFNIKTEIIKASELQLNYKKSDLILELCQNLGATNYLSGPFGKSYLNESKFNKLGIDIEYHEYVEPLYNQLGVDFIPNLSVVDSWMNCGNEHIMKYFLNNK